MDSITDGAVVLDAQNRILSINPAAAELARMVEADAAGKPFPDVFAPWLSGQGIPDSGGKSLTVPSPHDPERTIEISRRPLSAAAGENPGSVVFLRDVSDRIHMEQDHRRAMELLLEKNTEIQSLYASLRDQAVRDPVTGLYNRCYLMESLDLEMARASRAKIPVSVLIIRLDQYKKADERYGEKAGVEILKILSSLIHRYIRRGDIASRTAPDTFVVVLPGAPAVIAGPRAELLRQAFHNSILNYLGTKIECTFSCGVAASPSQGETKDALLQSAEIALHESIAAGGNRVTVHE
ncbi:MAG: GGDEF domain-containing protein [Anaerolineales bacterium]|nr:GGDEF domain-containing protein [Anaerolineales bacterium]